MAGRKRKIGSLTAQDYANQLHQLAQREQMHAETGAYRTDQQKEAVKRKRRSLKNRMCALKTREKRRARFDYLEEEAKRLRQRINILKQQNQGLQSAYRSGLIAEHKYRYNITRQRRTICPVPPPTGNIISKNNSFPMPSVPSSASPFLDAQKNSTLVKPCTRNCRPAVSTVRNIQPLNVAALNFGAQNNSTGFKPCTRNYRSAVSAARNIQSANALHSAQYSHTLRGIPWKSFRSINLALLNCTKKFVAAKTSKEILAQQITYAKSKRFLKRLFWKILVSTGYESNFVGVRGITPQQRACVIFDDICDNIYEAILERVGKK